MAIVPISSVEIDKNHSNMVSFGHKRNNKRGNQNRDLPSGTNTMKAIPVVVLMAMNPSLLNAKQPVMALPVNSENMTEMYAPSNPKSESPNTISYAEAAQGTAPSYGIMDDNIVIRRSKIVTCNGQRYNMVLASSSADDDPKSVGRIFLFKCDSNGNIDKNSYDVPKDKSGTYLYNAPYITGFVYHNMGDNNTFGGAQVLEVKQSPNGLWGIVKKYELKFDNDADAQYLINFMSSETQWKNNTRLKFTEKNTPDLDKTTVYNMDE